MFVHLARGGYGATAFLFCKNCEAERIAVHSSPAYGAVLKGNTYENSREDDAVKVENSAGVVTR